MSQGYILRYHYLHILFPLLTICTKKNSIAQQINSKTKYVCVQRISKETNQIYTILDFPKLDGNKLYASLTLTGTIIQQHWFQTYLNFSGLFCFTYTIETPCMEWYSKV